MDVNYTYDGKFNGNVLTAERLHSFKTWLKIKCLEILKRYFG